MTLDALIPQASTMTDADLKDKWLVMSAWLKGALLDLQAAFGGERHQVAPIELTDGRWAVCADVLSEIGEGGIFKSGFDALNPEEFANIEVITRTELEALFPQQEEEI